MKKIIRLALVIFLVTTLFNFMIITKIKANELKLENEHSQVMQQLQLFKRNIDKEKEDYRLLQEQKNATDEAIKLKDIEIQRLNSELHAKLEYKRTEQIALKNKIEAPTQGFLSSGGCDVVYQYNGWDHETMKKICFAESGGNTYAVNNNPTTGDYSVGLFQINIYGANAYSRPSEMELKDPSINVAWAYKIWQSGGYNQWGAYTSGAYLRYM